MGRKKADTSLDMRQLVIFHPAEGKFSSEIAALMQICKSTVADIVRQLKNEDRIESKPKTGRPKILSLHDERCA